MRRREFITLLGGAAAWPLAAHAQRPGLPVIAFINARSAESATRQAAAFRQGLAETGYVEGQNVAVEYHWLDGRYDRLPSLVADVVRRRVAVIATPGTTAAALAAKAATSTIPIVFGVGEDPVRLGLVTSLARPGGNATGFIAFEWSVSGKWLELLKEIAPGVTRAVVLRDSELGSGASQFAVIQAVAPSLRVEVNPVNVGGAAEIESAVAAFARAPNGGLIATGGGRIRFHRDLIVKLAARHKLPAVYYDRVFVDSGGLISYGPDFVDQFRRAAGYVDSVLKGEKPADLPVQAPTKYETILNLRTAKALGIEVPATLLARAYEVIE
jgi:putative ABC transport system substrate-binding protein